MDDCNFRVQVKNPEGVWVTVFYADFAHAMLEVRKLKRAGRLARFVGEEGRKAERRRLRRVQYRAVR